jgi:hypothetical protein
MGRNKDFAKVAETAPDSDAVLGNGRNTMNFEFPLDFQFCLLTHNFSSLSI